MVFRTAQSLEAVKPFIEWEQRLLFDDPYPEQFVTVVPFQVGAIPGNFRISTDSLLFPSYHTMLPPEERSTLKRNKKKAPEYFDRVLEVVNNFVVPITITSMDIGNSREYGLCSSVFSIPAPDSSYDANWLTADHNESWKLPIRFTFTDFLKTIRFPKKCILMLETDKVGRQSLPLIIHSGSLMIEAQNPDGGMQNNECMMPKNDTLFKERGLPCLYNWIKTNPEGQAFRDAMMRMDSVMKGGSCPKSAQKKSILENYFTSLLSGNDVNEVEPMLIKLGAVSSGSVITRSLLLTNMNPAPVEITVPSAAFENMDIEIGHSPISIPSALEQIPKSGDIKYFLTNSALARTFLSKMKYKVDISLSPRANAGELHSLYAGQAVIHTFQNASEYEHDEISQHMKDEMKCSTGYVFSTDGSYQKLLTSRKVGTKKWSIPPGGVARFKVTLRTPNRRELESDLSSFVATGLALETNHGQALPIILTYSVLLGQLHLLPASSYGAGVTLSKPSSEEVQVQSIIRGKGFRADLYADLTVPISIESTFSKEIYLGEIKSCNRWFEFTQLPKSQQVHGNSNIETSDHFEEHLQSHYFPIKSLSDAPAVVPVGRVQTAVSCSDEFGNTSFFACALDWLQNRDQIQPSGCGLSEDESIILRGNDHSEYKAVKTQAISVLKDAVSFMSTYQGALSHHRFFQRSILACSP
jgi:hypothetical protein